jgi:regulator of protease activity HflC (stomatin/prohibitin superfamily)
VQSLVDLIRGFFRGVRPWVVVAPWEQCLRVRLGKHVAVLEAGFHLRLPIIDAIYVQSIRRRVSSIGKQTITTKDDRTVTLGASLGYEITDVEQLYRGLHHAEDTLQQLARQHIAQYVATHDLANCTPADLEALASEMEIEGYGLANPELAITDFAVVRTYRLIGDHQYSAYGDSLSTQQVHTP